VPLIVLVVLTMKRLGNANSVHEFEVSFAGIIGLFCLLEMKATLGNANSVHEFEGTLLAQQL